MTIDTNKHSNWLVYILLCSDDTLYTGCTNDIDNRLKKHNTGVASKYTRCRLPVKLLYTEECRNKSFALKREYRIKQLTKKDKIQLIHRRKDK
jgi:putative endonuclease